jgi:FAD-dependent urate hydroxylase
MAIEDAVELARCVRDAKDVPAGLATYERLRRARVERVVAHGARSSSTKTVGPVGRVLRDLALPFMLRRMARPGANLQQWLFQHHIDWDAAA